MRFGRLPHNPAAVSSTRQHVYGAVQPLPVLDREAIPFTPGLYDNDTLGDCVPVSIINAARAQSYLNTDCDIIVNPGTVPAFYGAVLGNPPNLVAADGCNMLDVMTYQAAHGFPIGPQMLVGLHSALDPVPRPNLALTMQHFGAVVLGVTLYERDMEMLPVWDVQEGRDDGAVVGLHAIIGWDYRGLGDTDTVRAGTWGQWQPFTWSWAAARVDEAYALYWLQLEKAPADT